MLTGLPPPSDAITWAGSIAVGAITLALAVQKLLRIWAEGTTDLNKHEGENQVVNLLRSELNRLTLQSKELDLKVIELIHTIEYLRNQNLELQDTVSSNSRELKSLRSQQVVQPPDGRKE